MKKINLLALLFLAAIFATACGSENSEVLAVRLDKTSIELVKGETFQLTATVVPADEDAPITWFSEDESYVTVDQNGLVTAVALKNDGGTDADEENPYAVSVYAQYERGAAECEVTVLPLEPKALSLTPDQKTMIVGEQLMFTVGYEPEDVDVKDVEWSTTNASVAKVKDGIVTAVGIGGCEIVVNYGRIEARSYIFVMK